ncbi:MAG: hypothetical protein LQ348_004833 [Seirophora lacunosa]|nr:MAG: hypothetical protein LQ344_006213 [Seirophora lacunosa]KAI4182511.1 MAG: hypothetical protein LQ348_004833 [Seirophora lacunosa]
MPVGKVLDLGGRRLETTIGVGADSTTFRRTSTSTSSPDSTPAASSNSATAQSTQSSMPTSSTSSNPDSPPPLSSANSNKAGDKTGAGVGVPLGVALIAAVIYMLYLRNKQRGKRAEEVAGPGEGSAEEGVPGVDERQNLDGNAWNGYYGGYEMDGEGRRVLVAQLRASEFER